MCNGDSPRRPDFITLLLVVRHVDFTGTCAARTGSDQSGAAGLRPAESLIFTYRQRCPSVLLAALVIHTPLRTPNGSLFHRTTTLNYLMGPELHAP
jgi:hypothetical protein